MRVRGNIHSVKFKRYSPAHENMNDIVAIRECWYELEVAGTFLGRSGRRNQTPFESKVFLTPARAQEEIDSPPEAARENFKLYGRNAWRMFPYRDWF